MSHFVIIIPGLGNRETGFKFITSFWKLFGFTPIVKTFDWYDGAVGYQKKFDELHRLITQLYKDNNKVSLIGCSAGGSVAVNLFCQNKDKIHRTINVCGRLHKYNMVGWSNFNLRTKKSLRFKKSVEQCEENMKRLTSFDKRKILILSPLFGDEIVPVRSMQIVGVKNIKLFSFEHMLTIVLALTLYTKVIFNFLNSYESVNE